MALSTTQAAKEVGVTRQAITRAIHEGRLSATRAGDGSWKIEPVELLRVYPPQSSNGGTKHREVDEGCQAQADGLRRELALQNRLLAEREATIFDLRQRLDSATAELTKLTAVLASHLDKPAQPTGFWRRLLGKPM
jgi:excisionase family DNA binding protein